MKFKTGDLIRVIENGLTGEIMGISFNSILQDEEYIVEWTHAIGRHETYSVAECDLIWECYGHKMMIRMPQAIEFLPIDIKIDTSGPLKVQCNGHHTWIDVGFRFTKKVCKYCDVEKNGQD